MYSIQRKGDNMELLLVVFVVFYISTIAYWTYYQIKHGEVEIENAYVNYQNALNEYKKHPFSNESQKMAVDLGKRYYELKYPDVYGPLLHSPIYPLADTMIPFDKSNSNIIDNSTVRETKLQNDLKHLKENKKSAA